MIPAWMRYPGCPGVSTSDPHVNRSPYVVSTWGPFCGRGMGYATTGAPVASGTKGVVRKISTGRKARGSASDDFDRQEELRCL